nr:hypothetical protein [Tanacetum cinerariifolium]
MNDLPDDNNFFIFDDVNVRISPASKMPFRNKPHDSMHVRSKSNSNKSLPRTMHKWLPKLQPLAEPVAKWFPRLVKICLWIIDSGCSQHMTGNRALLTNFVEKFFGTVRFGNNDFAMIAGYGDVVIGLPKMKFEKDHLCSACKQGKIHWKHHKSKMAFASNKPLYLLHIDLCGPMCVQSINGKRYVLVVVNDCSRYTWRVRTDNGTKFKNKTLAKFFDEVGITQQFSAARMPQQNGVVERRNRTLVEAARAMLTFANLPSFLWIFLWIIDSGCSKHMTGNHVLLTNFVEKFLGTVRFGNNDFAVIAGYGDELHVKNVSPHMLRGSVLTMIKNFQRTGIDLPRSLPSLLGKLGLGDGV